MPQRLQPDDDVDVQSPHDQAAADPSRAGTAARLQARAGGYVARHPGMLKVLQWLGWNNPGGSIGP